MSEPQFTLTAEQLAYLQPWLNRLSAAPGSVVILAVADQRETPRIGWLFKREKEAVRNAIERANSAPKRRGEPLKTEMPMCIAVVPMTQS
jgi:hypothetical protein